MLTLLSSPSQIVTVNTDGRNIKKGPDMGQIGLLEGHSLIIEDHIIKDFIPNSSIQKHVFDKVIDLKDMVVLPGLIDCHTHTAFAGSRADEFRMKIAGIGYEEIARSGGGITRTVSSVREKSTEELVEIVKPRVKYFISQGVTTLEIKSGYGLSFEDEIKLLRVIRELQNLFPVRIIPTFLGAHTIPAEYKNKREDYVQLIINDMLPFVAREDLAVFCDGFCEETAFTPEEIDRIFRKAAALGMKIKLHSEQFNRIGGLETAIKYRAVSIDHLEAASDDDILKIAGTDTVCVLLPGVSFFLHYGYAPARALIKKNAAVALSTDYNPGSSHIANLNLIMSLAAIEMRMTIEETISAVTINAAKALDVSDETGSLEIGKRADISVFNTNEYSDIVYSVGKNLNCCTIKDGRIIYQNSEG